MYLQKRWQTAADWMLRALLNKGIKYPFEVGEKASFRLSGGRAVFTLAEGAQRTPLNLFVEVSVSNSVCRSGLLV